MLSTLSPDAISSILGWISIACWIVVYSPQIYENYKLKSGEGLSIPFVIVWLLGDLCNLVGALIAGLLPTVIILAIYYTLCDVTLLGQIYFYRWKRTRQVATYGNPDEESPLLTGDSRPKRKKPVSTKVFLLRYTAAICFVFGTGVAAWWISGDAQDKKHEPDTPVGSSGWNVHIFGWTSAVLYVRGFPKSAMKNLKTRCEGLSPAMFLFAIFGNLTYGISICTKSMDSKYLITNASWLAGSLLTVFLDVMVLSQFFYYQYWQTSST